MYREYHNQLPANIKEWLANRGITGNDAAKYFIGWNGSAITIPIFDRQGNFLFFKYRKNPFSNDERPKYWYDKGHPVALYNESILDNSPSITICEGEFDCILLNEGGMPAVTSTSGSGTFPEEWIKKFEQKQVYICMDNDDAGKRAAVRLLFLLPDAAIIPLPKDVGAHGDITDWRMQNLDKTFATLLARAYKFHPPFTLPDTLAGTIHQQSILRQMNIHFELRWVQDMALDILQMQREDLAYKEKKPKKKSNVDYTDKINAARAVPLDYFFKGQKPKRVNGKLFYKCPFHNEQTASFLVDNKNKFHCFGCGVHGDAIDFVQKFSNVDWHEAVKILTGEGIIV